MAKYDGENHMVVGNKDAKDLKCPDCGELATGQFVEAVVWCIGEDRIVDKKREMCPDCKDAHECVCGCIFNDEGRKLGTR